MPVMQERTFAPGARVEVRDEEWMVRSTKNTTAGGQAVHVVGQSELVRGKDAIFLTALDEVRELRPEETELVHDTSPQYRKARLYLESLLRRTPPTDPRIYVGHRAAIDPTEYQLQPAAKALRQIRPRILMADGVGLGKTIEVGVLLSELIRRGRGDRILVVALKSILSQFQKELWARFTIPLVRLDSVGIQRVQTRIPSNMNPFYFFDRVIISIDTLKRDEKYRRYLEESNWDVVVVDECQHVAIRTTGGRSQQSQRARLAQLLGRTSDALILTSATPHDGRPESFASLMNLLEPTAVANETDYTRDEVEEYFIRRFKKDIAHEVAEAFKERELTLEKVPASSAEDAVFEKLATMEFKTIARQRQRKGKGVLFRTLLLKSFLSSPTACISTIDHRLAHKDLEDEDDSRVWHDRQELSELRALAKKVTPREFSKYGELTRLLRRLGFDAADCKHRIVIFSERIDTLDFLDEQLKKDLKLKSKQIEIFHGSLDDQAQQGLVDSFGTESSPIRILLASDVASEGINLHHYCHRMVHFDLPWSLITLEQRNGRIDRYGQGNTPYISYLLTIPNNPMLQGDLRVLERLIEKEDHAHKNLGDVAWLLALHDAELEEDRIARGIEGREKPEETIPDEAQHTDFMDLLFGDDTAGEPAPDVGHDVRLFRDDLAYAEAAFKTILDDDSQVVEWHRHIDGFTLHPPDDLLKRFEYLPSELREGRNELKLTADRGRVKKALEQARQDEKKWPEWQLFWEHHPVTEWLNDRVLGEFTRHQAPVLRVAKGLEVGERAFVFQGVTSNHRSQPTIVDWFVVKFSDGGVGAVTDLADVIPSTGLDQSIANPGGDLPQPVLASLTGGLPEAVSVAAEHMEELRKVRAVELQARIRTGLRRLKGWRDQRLTDLDAKRRTIMAGGRAPRKDEGRRMQRERNEIEQQYQSRRNWVDQSLRTHRDPYLRVAAVLIAADGS